MFADRDRLRAHLAERGVDTEIYYPVPLHPSGVGAGAAAVRGRFDRWLLQHVAGRSLRSTPGLARTLAHQHDFHGLQENQDIEQ
jgi:hypothetical protein